jgi:hypothetical protein
MVYTNGFPEDAPLRAVGLQAYHSASFFAAIGTMSALWLVAGRCGFKNTATYKSTRSWNGRGRLGGRT